MLFPGHKQGERRLQDELCDYGILSNTSSHKVIWCSTWNVLQSPVWANALHTAKFPVFLNYRTPFSGRPSQRFQSSEHAIETLLCVEKGDNCWRGWLQKCIVEPMVTLPGWQVFFLAWLHTHFEGQGAQRLENWFWWSIEIFFLPIDGCTETVVCCNDHSFIWPSLFVKNTRNLWDGKKHRHINLDICIHIKTWIIVIKYTKMYKQSPYVLDMKYLFNKVHLL